MPLLSLPNSYQAIVDKILTYRLYSQLMALRDLEPPRNGSINGHPNLRYIRHDGPEVTPEGEVKQRYVVALRAKDLVGIKADKNKEILWVDRLAESLLTPTQRIREVREARKEWRARQIAAINATHKPRL